MGSKMISKKLIVFGTLIYLNCLCLVETNINLVRRYKKALNRGLNYKEYDFCTYPHKMIWVSACKTIVNIIKEKKGNEYRNSLFLNYFLFGAATSPWCVKNEVRFVNAEDVSIIGSRSVTQIMMPCYIRRDAVIPTENYTNEYLENDNFYIYPEHPKSWMFFKYDHESQSCELYEWFDIINNTVKVHPESLSKLPPLRISNDNKYALALSSFSNENTITQQNIVMRARSLQLRTLCSISYEGMPSHAEYLSTLSQSAYTNIKHPIKKVLIRIPGLEKRFESYARDCLMRLFSFQVFGYTTRKYKLSPGPTIDSILLLKASIAADGVEENNVVEAIVNVDIEHFRDLF